MKITNNITNSRNVPQISMPTNSQILAYAIPVLPVYFLYGPLVLLQGIYAKYFGVALTTIASVLLVSRLFDAVSDPIIGYLSDRYCARRGSRKRFVVCGGILFIVSSWFLYVPVNFNTLEVIDFGIHEPSPTVSGTYFLIFFLAFYLSYTLFEIPHLAWGGELVSSSKDKNKIYGMRSFFFFLGGLLFYVMPLMPWFDTNEFTPQTLKWSVTIAGFLMLPMLYFCVINVPDKKVFAQNFGSKFSDIEDRDLKPVLRAIITNKPLRILTAAHVCTGFGASMFYTLLFFLQTHILGWEINSHWHSL